MNPETMLSLIAYLAGEDLVAVSEQHLARSVQPREAKGGAVAVIPIVGGLMARSMQSWFGTFPGMDALRARIDAAARNPEVASIVLDIDSPGGTVAGTAETAAAVAAAAQRKPVVAVANSLAASAAYWIASQASEVVMAPNAMAGSIGVLAIHQNVSKLYERMGVETTVMRSGARKAEGHPFGPLDDAAREAIQARVDEAAGAFIAAVASGRKMTPKQAQERFGDGRVMSAREALSTGLADREATLDEVVAGLRAGTGRAWRRRAAFAFA
jgi:capsid assembly protease